MILEFSVKINLIDFVSASRYSPHYVKGYFSLFLFRCVLLEQTIYPLYTKIRYVMSSKDLVLNLI